MKIINHSFEERRKIFSDIIAFLRKTYRYNASLKTEKDREKSEYTLLRRTHIIEKGMSFRNPKHGFGQAKVESLIDDLMVYLDGFGNSEFFNYPVSAISNYLDYTRNSGVKAEQIAHKLSILKSKLGYLSDDNDEQSGVVEVQKDYIINHNKDFRDLLFNRHSIRYFSEERVPEELLIEALTLAQKTPSACNRQGWKTHVYYGDDSVNLVKWQGGSRGFEEEIRCAILVTANLKAFLSHEIHQAYVDGGLYAMNLINALTYLGLGTIPLSCGFHESRLKGLTKFEVPENEAPVLIIGIGMMEDKFKVAVSKRKAIDETNTFHKLKV